MAQDKEKTESGNQTALARWETEGGALLEWTIPEHQHRKHMVFDEQEQYVLYCLGGALLMQWNDLPTNIQRALFERAAALSKQDQTSQLREQIARFLHNRKDD